MKHACKTSYWILKETMVFTSSPAPSHRAHLVIMRLTRTDRSVLKLSTEIILHFVLLPQ